MWKESATRASECTPYPREDNETLLLDHSKKHELGAIPTVISSKKKAESMARRIMILVDLENAIFCCVFTALLLELRIVVGAGH